MSAVASDVSQAAEMMMSESPEPQLHAIEQRQVEVQEVKRDSKGVAFDESLHTGSVKKDGTWRVKNVRKSSGSTLGSNAGTAASEPPKAIADPSIEKARAAGIGSAQMLVMLCVTLGGEDWKPRTEPIDESAFLQQAFGDYFVAKNMADIPPGMILTFALVAYAGPRFTMPATRQRVGGLIHWVKVTLAKRRIKKKFKSAGIRDAEVSVVDGKLMVNGVTIPDLQP